jgi:hypothetical protein
MVAAVCVVGAAVRASTSGPGGLEDDKRAWVRASTCRALELLWDGQCSHIERVRNARRAWGTSECGARSREASLATVIPITPRHAACFCSPPPPGIPAHPGLLSVEGSRAAPPRSCKGRRPGRSLCGWRRPRLAPPQGRRPRLERYTKRGLDGRRMRLSDKQRARRVKRGREGPGGPLWRRAGAGGRERGE